MKILGLVISGPYGKNEVFNEASPLNRDDCLRHFRHLRAKLGEIGVSAVSHDMVRPRDAWGYLFLDYQKDFMNLLDRQGYGGHRFLAIFESEVICPENWDSQNHRGFESVFAWNPEAFPRETESPRYIQYHWPNNLEAFPPFRPFEKREGFCVIMSGNKWKPHQKELYSERVNVIEWFLDNHPEKIDLYGPGWAVSRLTKLRRSIQNCFRFIVGRQRRPNTWRNYPFYKGVAESKLATLGHYRFCICYENARDIPGYITEKIFDCFIAGVVPVYLGWKDVDRFIPRETFIDKRQFPTYENLYSFMSNMSTEEYEDYLNAIQNFLVSEAARKFDAETFVDILIEGMGLNNPINLEGGSL